MPNRERGGWEVVKQVALRSSGRYSTQADALRAARNIAGKDGGGQITVHGSDGLIRESVTVSEASAAARARLVADSKRGIVPDPRIVDIAKRSAD